MGRDCFLGNECLFHVVVVFDLDGRGGQEEEGEGEGWGEERLGGLGRREGQRSARTGHKDEPLEQQQ